MKQKYANYIIVLLYSNSLKKIKFYIAYALVYPISFHTHTHKNNFWIKKGII